MQISAVVTACRHVFGQETESQTGPGVCLSPCVSSYTKRRGKPCSTKNVIWGWGVVGGVTGGRMGWGGGGWWEGG